MEIEQQAESVLGQMAVPKNSLGLLEKQVKKLFCAWGRINQEIKPFHIVFAADNGITEEAVVRQPIDITYLQARNMTRGKATISCFCRINGVPFEVVDVGINNAASVGINRKTARGTKNFLREPAMSKAEYETAAASGRERVRQAVHAGCNLLSFGEMGIGNTTTSSAVLHAITAVAPEFIVGYGANKCYPEVIRRKREVITCGVEKWQGLIDSPAAAIRCVGGFDIAALTGAMEECAVLGVPFVLDGFITAVAFACAVKENARVSRYALASHMSREPGMQYALGIGGIQPEDVPICAGLALGEGTGAILGIMLLKTMLYAVMHVDKMANLTAAVKDDTAAAL